MIYQLPFLAHAPMEPINTTIHVRPDGAEVWVGTQVPPRAQATVARITGLPVASVVVHNQFMGGAFGRRLDIDSITQAARLAKNLPFPVKFIWSREEDIQHDLFRAVSTTTASQRGSMRTGASPAGRTAPPDPR